MVECINPIALRMAKTQLILAILSAIGLTYKVWTATAILSTNVASLN